MKIEQELLIRYLSGTTDSIENDQINSWLSESEENKEILEQCYFIWQSTGLIHTMNTVDTQKALTEFKRTVSKKRIRKTSKNMLVWMQRVAAVLFIPTLLLAYYFYKTGDDEVMQYMEIRTNSGMISSVILPDSSKVWLNSCGYLRYPVRFSEKRREVELQGEAYFEVEKQVNSPFIVKVEDDYAVEVLGTKFNVSAYPEDNSIETTLVEGSVRLNVNTKTKKGIQYVLRPNERGTLADGILSVNWVDPIYETGWKDGKMYFKNHSMEEVIKRLSRHYNVTFDVKNPEVLESLITAKFESEQLPQVMEYLRLASGIKYKIQNKDINDERLSKVIIELTK